MKRFALVFGGIGAISLLFAGTSYFREQSFLERAEVVTGTVTDYTLSSSNNSGTTYCPVVDFTTKNGEPVKYYANVCSWPSSYDIGEQVEVLYDPQDITDVQMNGFWSKYTGVVVDGCIGLLFFLLGAWGLFAGRTRPATKKDK